MNRPETKVEIAPTARVFGRGFTIVEMLVVVAIIGILASIVAVTYNSAQIRAGDTERESDILMIKQAIDKYANENGVYPQQGSTVGMDTNFPVATLGLPREAIINPDAPGGTTNSISQYNYGSSLDYTGYGYRAFHDGGGACWQSNASCVGYKLVYKKRESGEVVRFAGGVCTTAVSDTRCNSSF